MDIRQHLNSELTTDTDITAVVARIFPGLREQGTALPALVWRCTKFDRGESIVDDDGTRLARFEIEVWADDLDQCIAIKDVLVAKFHGEGSYEFGGAASPLVDPILIDSSRVSNEFDGGRVRDTFSEEAAVPLTIEVEFQWHE